MSSGFMDYEIDDELSLKQVTLLILGLVPAFLLTTVGTIALLLFPGWGLVMSVLGMAGTAGLSMGVFAQHTRSNYFVVSLLLFGELGIAPFVFSFFQALPTSDLSPWSLVALGWLTCGPAVSGLVLVIDAVRARRRAPR